MKWGKERPRNWQERWVRKFAWFPVTLDTCTVWFEDYMAEEFFSRRLDRWIETGNKKEIDSLIVSDS